MWMSSADIRASLAAHSRLGLAIGALMYLVCLTGALVVFADEFERWEQPWVAETTHYSVAQIEAAVMNTRPQLTQHAPVIRVILPTASMPRLQVVLGEQAWYVDATGHLREPHRTPWTDLLRALHIQLRLPQTLGVILVGILGVLLCSLIVTGVLAHPSLLRDAFRWRRGGTGRLAEIDLHNRLGVWGLPFHLMIGLTGAFLGLIGLFITAAAWVRHSDPQAVMDQLYGADVQMTQQAQQRLALAPAFADLRRRAPGTTPLYVAVHFLGSDRQYVEIAASLPRRLVYSEIYRFTLDGRFINHQALADGPAGRQLAYSVYRLHFGWFGPWLVKLLYGVMGLALTVICTSGIRIWLQKRPHRSAIDDLWTAWVWGTPLALALAAAAGMIGLSPLGAFLIGLALSAAVSLRLADTRRSSLFLRRMLGGILIGVIALHAARFGLAMNRAALGFDVVLLCAALMIAAGASRGRAGAA